MVRNLLPHLLTRPGPPQRMGVQPFPSLRLVLWRGVISEMPGERGEVFECIRVLDSKEDGSDRT